MVGALAAGVARAADLPAGYTLKRNFVPCVRNSDGAIGLYDLAATGSDKVFYANDGTGTFGLPSGVICTVTIGEYPHLTAAWTCGEGTVTNAIGGNSFSILKGMTGVKVIFTADRNYKIVEGNAVVELEGAVTENVVFGAGNDYAIPTAVCTLDEVAYLDWDDEEKKMTNATLSVDYEIVSRETRKFADGKWYVVADTVVVTNGANIKVNGLVRLILCDNASLTIRNVANYTAALGVRNITALHPDAEIGLNFDTANQILYGADNPTNAYVVMKKWIEQVHIKDCYEPYAKRASWAQDVEWGCGDVSRTYGMIDFLRGRRTGRSCAVRTGRCRSRRSRSRPTRRASSPLA